jgi:hypothetical protein
MLRASSGDIGRDGRYTNSDPEILNVSRPL